MKRFLLLYGLLTTFVAGAQTNPVPNASFENWTKTLNVATPESWITSDLYYQFVVPGHKTGTSTRSTSSRTGSFALRLNSDTASKQVLPGFATVKFAVSARHPALTGYYKGLLYDKDFAAAEVALTRWNTVRKRSDTIGYGNWYTYAQVLPAYALFTASVTYIDNNPKNVPDSASIVLSTVSDTSSRNFGYVLFDDLALTSATSQIAEIISQPEALSGNLDSRTGTLTIFNAQNLGAVNLVELYDLMGRRVGSSFYNTALQTEQITLQNSFAGIAPGIYVVRVLGPTKEHNLKIIAH